MDSYILRESKSIPADEVFDAWTSNDLKKILAVLNRKTLPVDRHYLLINLVVLLKPILNI